MKNKLVKTLATTMLALLTALSLGTSSYAANSSQSIATGIDVSKYNGTVNWGAVAGTGVKYAFIRVGNPQTGLDPQFAANMRNAAAAGIRTGVYYYSHATTVEAATLEAMQTLNWINGYTVNYPVVYDVEASGQRSLSAAQMQAIVNTYCSIIDAAGYYPVVYSYKSFMQSKLGGIPWDKWVAQYAGNLDYNGAAFWQYTNKARIPGVNTNVDMNYQFKNYDQLIVANGFVPHNGGIRLYLNWKMQTGFTNLGDVTVYNDPLTGALQTGWFVTPDGNTYYAESTGAIAKGVYVIKDVIYYFNEKGALVRNGSVTIDGLKFVTTEDGIILPVTP